jgi:hypothetical protein
VTARQWISVLHTRPFVAVCLDATGRCVDRSPRKHDLTSRASWCPWLATRNGPPHTRRNDSDTKQPNQ